MRWLPCGLFLLSMAAFAGPVDDATTLKDDALKILKDNATKEATPEEYATAILNLERAQALLEGAGDADGALAQEISASLFWARRFSNVKVLSALDALKGKLPAQPAAPKKAAPAAVKTPPKPAAAAAAPGVAETPEMARIRAADAAFAAAQAYVASKGGDDYAIALGWFKMAGEHAGTDAALKALELARQAQARFTGIKPQIQEELPNTPEMELVKQADALVQGKNYEPAFPMYEQSLKLKESVLTFRRLANAHYLHAQQIREKLKPKFEANARAYEGAMKASYVKTRLGMMHEPNHPAIKGWYAERAALQKEADVAYRSFEAAEKAFAKVIKLSPQGKDFEAAAYMGICIGVRPFFRSKGVTTLEEVIKTYTPANDVERSLYEFCKTEIARLKKGG